MTKSSAMHTPWRHPRSSESANPDHAANGRSNIGMGCGSDPPNKWASITDSRGYLLRQRPGWDVPVGPRDAVELSKGFTDKEIAILVAVEQLGMISAEQLARAFFNTHRSAYEKLLIMAQKRFLVNPGADPLIVRRAVGHRPPPRNPVYALDWNGAYLLAYCHNYPLPNWRAATAALITTRLGHNLGVSETWSYLLAAARATQEHEEIRGSEGQPLHDYAEESGRRGQEGGEEEGGAAKTVEMQRSLYPYRLSLAFRNERASLLPKGDSRPVQGATPMKASDRVLLQPDGTFVLVIHRATPGHISSPIIPDGAPSGGAALLEAPGAGQSISPRWSPTLDSWYPSFLSCSTSSEVMLSSEKLAASDPGCPYYRMLLLEMETGSNNVTDTIAKIKSYNRIIRGNQEAWTRAYGISPRVLVVVPTDSQIEAEAVKWRLHYFYKQETAVLLTTLETLARSYHTENWPSRASRGGQDSQDSRSSQDRYVRHSRRALIEQPCWLDVMADCWRPLGEALGIEVAKRIVSRERAGLSLWPKRTQDRGTE